MSSQIEGYPEETRLVYHIFATTAPEAVAAWVLLSLFVIVVTNAVEELLLTPRPDRPV